jgi:hypothetical protein
MRTDYVLRLTAKRQRVGVEIRLTGYGFRPSCKSFAPVIVIEEG